MRVFWQAIRAATIETLGVAFIIVVLFGVPTWTLADHSRILPQRGNVGAWLEFVREKFQNRPAVAKPDIEARQRYAEQRLSHYSQSFQRAASDHFHGVINPL
jgi:hypothetical protein